MTNAPNISAPIPRAPGSPVTRRDFIARSALGATTLACGSAAWSAPAPEPIIDIHQHTSFGGKWDAEGNVTLPGRSDEQLVAHQQALGVTKTILLPAGHPVRRPSTLDGRANGLGDGNKFGGTCGPNETCHALAQRHPARFAFGANEVSDLDGTTAEIEKYLKLGAVIIGEQKFSIECDSPAMQRIYELAAAYRVPVLMHWQAKSFNRGLERFYKMLEKFPRTDFIGHAPTWWAHIDRNHRDGASKLYPTGKVTPGGLTDRYLRDYPNMYGDLAAGSGATAIGRDAGHGATFIERHQDKLLFGSDCHDAIGRGGRCWGSLQITQLRALAPSKAVERKILYENARKLFRF